MTKFDVFRVVMVLAACVAAAILVVAVLRALKRERERGPGVPAKSGPFPSTQDPTSEAPESGLPSSDGARVGGRGGPSEREALAQVMRDRVRMRLCMVCAEEVARYQAPDLVLAHPWLEPLYRRLNVPMVNRWIVEVTFPIETHPEAMCGDCRDVRRKHLDTELSEKNREYARFVEGQMVEMQEFRKFGLNERMVAELTRMRKGKAAGGVKAAKVAPPDNVRRLPGKAAGEQ